MDDLRSRVANRTQLTSDGHKAYLDAVEGAFGGEINFSMLVKLYGAASCPADTGSFETALSDFAYVVSARTLSTKRCTTGVNPLCDVRVRPMATPDRKDSRCAHWPRPRHGPPPTTPVRSEIPTAEAPSLPPPAGQIGVPFRRPGRGVRVARPARIRSTSISTVKPCASSIASVMPSGLQVRPVARCGAGARRGGEVADPTLTVAKRPSTQ